MSSEFLSLINIFSEEILYIHIFAFKRIVNLLIIKNLISENIKIQRRKNIIVHNIYIFKINFR